MNFPRVKPGDMPSARMYNALLAEVERLGKLSVAAPMQMSDGPFGPQIFLGTTFGKPPIIAKAAVEEGTYPTMKSFSEAVISTSQQKNWQFILPGEFVIADGAEADPGFTESDPAEYVWAYNPTGQYIRAGDLCPLVESGGGWIVLSHTPMPPIIVTQIATDWSGSGGLDMGTVTAYSGIPADFSIDANSYVSAGLTGNFTEGWKYIVTNWQCQGE